jgi:hypothetical protein
VSKRVYGCSGHNSYDFGCSSYDLYDTDGVFTGAWMTNWAGNIGVWNRGYIQDRAYKFDYSGTFGGFLGSCLVVCSGNKHLWVGEVCGGDFISWSRGSVM